MDKTNQRGAVKTAADVTAKQREALLFAFREMCRAYPSKCSRPEDLQEMARSVISNFYPGISATEHSEMLTWFPTKYP